MIGQVECPGTDQPAFVLSGSVYGLVCSDGTNTTANVPTVSILAAPADTPLDYATLGQFWGFGVIVVVMFFGLGRGVGLIFDLLKKG